MAHDGVSPHAVLTAGDAEAAGQALAALVVAVEDLHSELAALDAVGEPDPLLRIVGRRLDQERPQLPE